MIALWRVVGPGFLWLAAGVGLLLGGAAWAAGGGVPAGIATVALLAAAVTARRPGAAATGFGIASLGFLIVAASLGTWPAAVTGAVALGGVTDEMLLGHWYLVDPRLPRRPLRRLALAALAGIVLDTGWLFTQGALSWSATETGIGWAFLVLGTAERAAGAGSVVGTQGAGLLGGHGRHRPVLSVGADGDRSRGGRPGAGSRERRPVGRR